MPGLFDALMNRHEAERHRRLLGKAPPHRRRSVDGFLPLKDAAHEMGVSVDELVQMVRGGLLEYLEGSGTIYVRPAVVSRMLVWDGPRS
jgi:hypothetical protein